MSEKGLIAAKEKFLEECKANGISLEPPRNCNVDTKLKVKSLNWNTSVPIF